VIFDIMLSCQLHVTDDPKSGRPSVTNHTSIGINRLSEEDRIIREETANEAKVSRAYVFTQKSALKT
jgi:hypothetical protein